MEKEYEYSPSLQRVPPFLNSVSNFDGDKRFHNTIEVFSEYAKFNDGLKFEKGTPENGKNFAVKLLDRETEDVARWQYKKVVDPKTGKYLRTEKESSETELVPSYKFQIIIGQNFKNEDLPKLIREITKQNEKVPADIRVDLKTQKLLAEKYRARAADISKMLNQKVWDSKDETTRDARKIWSKRAFHAFAMSEAYGKGRELRDKTMSVDFETFLNENSDGAISKSLQKSTARLLLTKRWMENVSGNFGNFMREMAEIYAADSEIFSLGDFDQIRVLLIDEISKLEVSAADKIQLQTFVESQVLAREISKSESEKSIKSRDQNRSEKIETFLRNLAESLDQKIDKIYKKNSQKRNRRELEISDQKFDRDLELEMMRDLEKIIYERGEKEMIRISGLPEVFKDAWPDIFSVINKKYFSQNFGKEWRNFKKISEKIKKEKDPVQKAKMQEAGAEILCALLYSQKFIKGSIEVYSLTDIRKKRKANCIGQAAILHAIGEAFLDAEIWFATTRSHAFAILKTADEKKPFFSLDGPVNELDISDRDGIHFVKEYTIIGGEKMPWITVNRDFSRGYTGSVLDWMKDITENPQLGLFLSKQTVQRNPEHPGFRSNLAVAFSYSGKWESARREYEAATSLDKTNPWYAIAFANFLSGGMIWEFTLKNDRGEEYERDLPAARKEFERALELIMEDPIREDLPDLPKDDKPDGIELGFAWIYKIRQILREL